MRCLKVVEKPNEKVPLRGTNSEGNSSPSESLFQGRNVEELVLVKLDRHKSYKTPARTWWTLPEGAVFVWCNDAPEKTHWNEYYLIPPESTLIKHRITNRGNYHETGYIAEELKASWEEIPPEFRR